MATRHRRRGRRARPPNATARAQLALAHHASRRERFARTATGRIVGRGLGHAPRSARAGSLSAMYRHREWALVDVATVDRPNRSVLAHENGELVDARDGNEVAHNMAAVALRLDAELLL